MARRATPNLPSAPTSWVTPVVAQTSIPMYRQVTAMITLQMDLGRLCPGELLPPEVDLARQFGVSRQTVRAGLEELVRTGRLERQLGRCRVMRRMPIEQNLTHFYSLAEEMRRRGTTLQTQVLARGRFSPEDRFAARACERLLSSTAEQVGYVWRLREVEGAPVFLEMIAFPSALCPYFLEAPVPGEADLGAAPLYETLEQRSQLQVTRARETFRLLLPNGYEARLLAVPFGTAVFEVERTSFVEERPVEWRRTLVRGDRYFYAVDLVHPREAGYP